MNLSDRIGKRARGKPSPSRGNVNHAVFLAIRHDVKKALDDGWSILAIFQTLHEEGVVTFSYQAFRRYVNRLILSRPAT
ncbi:MAG: TraK family protein, partial [Rhodoferax sp.]